MEKKTVIITGGSSGIGKSTAIALLTVSIGTSFSRVTVVAEV